MPAASAAAQTPLKVSGAAGLPGVNCTQLSSWPWISSESPVGHQLNEWPSVASKSLRENTNSAMTIHRPARDPPVASDANATPLHKGRREPSRTHRLQVR